MNKKLNTFLFLLAGTVVNIGIMLFLLILFLFIIGRLPIAEANPQLVSALMLASVLLSVVGSFLIYSRIIKLVNRKWDLEKYMDPLFKKKR